MFAGSQNKMLLDFLKKEQNAVIQKILFENILSSNIIWRNSYS